MRELRNDDIDIIKAEAWDEMVKFRKNKTELEEQLRCARIDSDSWRRTAEKLEQEKQALQRRVEEFEQINESLNVQNCHLMQPPHEARG